MAQAIGRRKSKCLPFFHALTGCDTTSSFLGHGKWSAWETWVSFPEVSESFEQLCKAPERPSTACLSSIERFVILLYDGTSTCTSILRAAYQGGHIWGQVLNLSPTLPSPDEWGWMKQETGLFCPLWTTIPQASLTT